MDTYGPVKRSWAQGWKRLATAVTAVVGVVGLALGWIVVSGEPEELGLMTMLWIAAVVVTYLLIRLLGWVVEGFRGA